MNVDDRRDDVDEPVRKKRSDSGKKLFWQNFKMDQKCPEYNLIIELSCFVRPSSPLMSHHSKEIQELLSQKINLNLSLVYFQR
jgi:hypothetical protein